MLRVVIYNHQYGTDVTALTRSELTAREAAIKLVKEWRDSFNIDPNITDEEALDDWTELTSGRESIEIATAPDITD